MQNPVHDPKFQNIWSKYRDLKPKKSLGEKLKSIDDFVGGVAKGVFNLRKHLVPSSSLERAIGVVVLILVYLVGWIDGYERSYGDCETLAGCDALQILYGMLGAILDTFCLLMIGAMVVYIIDVLIMAVLFIQPEKLIVNVLSSKTGWMDVAGKLLGGNNLVSFKITFSWIFNHRLLLALIFAMILTSAFAFNYVFYIKVNRKVPQDQRAMAVRHIYIFNLAIVVLMLVAQLVIDDVWSKAKKKRNDKVST